jgi:hypothetical protein
MNSRLQVPPGFDDASREEQIAFVQDELLATPRKT